MITVYGKAGCVNCVKARNFLDRKKIQYEYIDLGANPASLEWIIQKGHKQVPQIYDGETYVGTYQGLVGYVLQNINSLKN